MRIEKERESGRDRGNKKGMDGQERDEWRKRDEKETDGGMERKRDESEMDEQDRQRNRWMRTRVSKIYM